METYLFQVAHGLSLIASVPTIKNICVELLLDIHQIGSEQLPGVSTLRAGSVEGEISDETANAVTMAMREHDFYRDSDVSGRLARALAARLDTNSFLRWFHLDFSDELFDSVLAKVLPKNNHLLGIS
eukprot:scaffold3226_cov160-Amphora_coffeaeformis.AAC.19